VQRSATARPNRFTRLGENLALSGQHSETKRFERRPRTFPRIRRSLTYVQQRRGGVEITDRFRASARTAVVLRDPSPNVRDARSCEFRDEFDFKNAIMGWKIAPTLIVSRD
jgi:hypothetical protein